MYCSTLTASVSACSVLTSHTYDCHNQLENAVDQRECKHYFQLSRIKGQLDNGAAQLGVLEACLQSNGSTSEWGNIIHICHIG